MSQLYDALGRHYRSYRRPDPRVAAAITRALGDAASVVNVGAGAGSAAVVRASAPDLPFADGSFDAALAVLTVHHWLGPGDVVPVLIPRDCSDGFTGAYWGRPEGYLDAGVRGGDVDVHEARGSRAGAGAPYGPDVAHVGSVSRIARLKTIISGLVLR